VLVPEVLAVSDGEGALAHLVLEWIDVGGSGPTTEADLGRARHQVRRQLRRGGDGRHRPVRLTVTMAMPTAPGEEPRRWSSTGRSRP
jgi:hypothetical protein